MDLFVFSEWATKTAFHLDDMLRAPLILASGEFDVSARLEARTLCMRLSPSLSGSRNVVLPFLRKDPRFSLGVLSEAFTDSNSFRARPERNPSFKQFGANAAFIYTGPTGYLRDALPPLVHFGKFLPQRTTHAAVLSGFSIARSRATVASNSSLN
jgi:hypothetical protein